MKLLTCVRQLCYPLYNGLVNACFNTSDVQETAFWSHSILYICVQRYSKNKSRIFS